MEPPIALQLQTVFRFYVSWPFFTPLAIHEQTQPNVSRENNSSAAAAAAAAAAALVDCV
jgi:hypothetical protein